VKKNNIYQKNVNYFLDYVAKSFKNIFTVNFLNMLIIFSMTDNDVARANYFLEIIFSLMNSYTIA